jgi:hypothetical protein
LNQKHGRFAFSAILGHMTVTASAMSAVGADPQTILLIAGGLGVVGGELAVRLLLRRDDDSKGGGGTTGLSPVAA